MDTRRDDYADRYVAELTRNARQRRIWNVVGWLLKYGAILALGALLWRWFTR
jgi:hypothetical protein